MTDNSALRANLGEMVQAAPWKAVPHFVQPTDSWDLKVPDPSGSATLALTPASTILVATVRNALAAAAQAAKAQADGFDLKARGVEDWYE